MQENSSNSDNRGMVSECRFDGVMETMEFKNLLDRPVCTGCTGLAQLNGRPRVSRSTRSYDVSYVDQKAPRSVY